MAAESADANGTAVNSMVLPKWRVILISDRNSIDRLKFWYRHKLHGFQDAYEFPTCVGCGRCTVSCPAEIDDIVGVVVRLEGRNDRKSIYAKEEAI